MRKRRETQPKSSSAEVDDGSVATGDRRSQQLSTDDASTSRKLVVRYCTSCGMRRRADELQKFLERHYPSLEGRIAAEEYGPSFAVRAVTASVFVVQAFLLLVALNGERVFKMLGMEETRLLAMVMVLVITFLAKGLSRRLSNTGAFEVLYGGELVYSKLQTGLMPTADDVIDRLTELGLTE